MMYLSDFKKITLISKFRLGSVLKGWIIILFSFRYILVYSFSVLILSILLNILSFNILSGQFLYLLIHLGQNCQSSFCVCRVESLLLINLWWNEFKKVGKLRLLEELDYHLLVNPVAKFVAKMQFFNFNI